MLFCTWVSCTLNIDVSSRLLLSRETNKIPLPNKEKPLCIFGFIYTLHALLKQDCAILISLVNQTGIRTTNHSYEDLKFENYPNSYYSISSGITAYNCLKRLGYRYNLELYNNCFQKQPDRTPWSKGGGTAHTRSSLTEMLVSD